MAKRVLIIDDEPDILKMLSKRLLDYRFDVDTAVNALDGLKKIYANLPDVIILDIMMPDMDGNEMAEELRQNEKTTRIPIIFLSALQSKENEKLQGNLVGDHYVFAKPYEITAIVSKINEVTSIKV